MKKVYIESVTSLMCTSDHPSADLKKELEVLSTQKFRRINRYILLGLCGVFNLPEINHVDKSSALYIGTKNGCISETVSMLGQIYRDELLPMPFTFIGSSTNMASYHIANALGLHGGNYTLSHRYAPFECALDMAYWDMVEGKSNSAIVGCIDEAALPLEAFKEVVGMGDVAELYEGGYWLSLTTHANNPIAEVVESKRFKTFAQVEAYLPREVKIIHDDSYPDNQSRGYIGSNSGLMFVEALQEGVDEQIAYVTQLGQHQFLMLMVKSLSVNDYN
ncbi:MAG: beta-ketoacyl synthase N-terminal-like domain-containing protein [Sulfuricurvum sp.]|uniref:beta-ketoacyl synthase N-terminal-like domain-containing protein n=1 Tax=Sulfuricurvum sp. TaxID=2025608 RepID=UPI002612B315|nr:beta-ketoacyl synthase N-terminal-like domain-containing protein [Sulfuricurvum sp.]MDD2829451.1 beta-ketoacyl synthase N-terminal-like domain-containing protein [Sulfuricurvum sp.]MDD4948466.1 beta-ketoacyl synthase N-terminal-like domain-containing protein [Sulfuricurvum sp.]